MTKGRVDAVAAATAAAAAIMTAEEEAPYDDVEGAGGETEEERGADAVAAATAAAAAIINSEEDAIDGGWGDEGGDDEAAATAAAAAASATAEEEEALDESWEGDDDDEDGGCAMDGVTDSETAMATANGSGGGSAGLGREKSGSGSRKGESGNGSSSLFPCIEQPLRCYISSLPSSSSSSEIRRKVVQLSSAKDGKVRTTTNRSGKEQFYLIPNDDQTFTIRSCKFGRYLTLVDPPPNVDGTCGGGGGGLGGSGGGGGGLGGSFSSFGGSMRRMGSFPGLVGGAMNRSWSSSRSFASASEKDADAETAATTPATSPIASAGAGGGASAPLVAATTSRESPGDWEKWVLVRAELPDRRGGDLRFFIRSVEGNSNVARTSMSSDSSSSTSVIASDTKSDDEIWCLEFLSGELCFLSSPLVDRRVRCDLVGRLGLTDNWKGWEVWRLIECGGGRVKINSWMHSQYSLVSDPMGKVMASSRRSAEGEEEEGWDEWTVTKAPAGGEGVTIRSFVHGRVLCLGNAPVSATAGEDGEEEEDEAQPQPQPQAQAQSARCLRTVKDRNDNDDDVDSDEEDDGGPPEARVFHLEAGHLQKYALSCAYDNTDMSLGPFPYVNDNKRHTDGWKIERRDHSADKDDGEGDEGEGGRGDTDKGEGEGDEAKVGNTVTLFLASQERYIGTNSDGNVHLSAEVTGSSELWSLDVSTDGRGYVLRSERTGGILTHCENDDDPTGGVDKLEARKLRVVATADNGSSNGDSGSAGQGQHKAWRLDPILPRAVSSSKIRTFAIGTSIAVGTTVAMPFAMAGVVGILGAQSALASIVTVGLTGAEAIASVGAIGATAAIVFFERGDSLGLASHDVAEERGSEEEYTKRPFCDWRSW